jgi:hypothetical protein
MGAKDQFRSDARQLVLNVLAQVLWVGLVAGAAAVVAVLAYLVRLRGTDLAGLWNVTLQVPAWLVLLAAVISFGVGILIFVMTRRASVVRGRVQATEANVKLLASRRSVAVPDRVVRSTRFGRWPPAEDLTNRSMFRDELDEAILKEGTDVRRIWNLNSEDDVVRLLEILKKYEGRDNHSIRAFFGIPDFAMPELLVVEGRGASISFPSTRSPHGLDWAIRFNRPDLMYVMKDYFEVLWDRAERILDSGQIVTSEESIRAMFASRVAEASGTTRNDQPRGRWRRR